MPILAAIVAASAIGRAELIDRFKRPPAVRADGLVQVCADCPADMRREYLMPAAQFADGVCKAQYSARRAGHRREKPRFAEPGIAIHLGDLREPATNVFSRIVRRSGGSRFTKIYVPSPGHADIEALRAEIARAFFLAVDGEEIGLKEAYAAAVAADPDLRAESAYADLERWENGEKTGRSDEEMLRLARTVLRPGFARPSDVLRFASRLFLYPAAFDSPFCGRFAACGFAQAVDLAATDPRIRFAAFAKAPTVVAFGGGRGDELYAAASAYSQFLLELARMEKTREELLAMLDGADALLGAAMEKARLEHPEKTPTHGAAPQQHQPQQTRAASQEGKT